MLQKMKWLIVYLSLTFLVAACTPIVAPANNAEGTASPVEAQTPVETETPANTTAEPVGDLLLSWQGYTEMVDGDTTTCKALTIDSDNVVRHGLCDDEASMSVAEGYLPLHWQEIQDRFAPFTLTSEQETITFQGSGEIEGDAWQRAIATCARTTYGEAVTGRTGASVRTAMSWWLSELPEQPGFRPHLVLLNYGYAYISIEPCAGGEATARAEGWLESSEWEALDQWLYSRAPLYQENNYLAGVGTEEMSAAEVADLVQWVESTYQRMAEAAPAFAE